MDDASLHELLSGRRRGPGASLLRGALAVAAWGYCAAMSLRNTAYDRRWLTIHKAKAPVISLGNITTGGTGKTPMAAWLANWLLLEGQRPGLLSRGYRSLAATPSSPQGAVSPTSAGNDEQRVLDRLCPGVPHLQQRDRVASAKRLCDEFGCDVLILDDGFQHRRLQRDLDLVLVDALQPWGFEHVLPRGLLREPMSGLRRADLIIVTRADQCSGPARERLRSELIKYRGTPECVEVAFKPQRLIDLDGNVQPIELLATRKSLAFCGIGNPEGFRQTLASLGAIGEFRVYPDHHHYHEADLDELAKIATTTGAEIVVATLKDLVKISRDAWNGPPLHAVDIGIEFLAGEDLLTSRLRQLLTVARSTE